MGAAHDGDTSDTLASFPFKTVIQSFFFFQVGACDSIWSRVIAVELRKVLFDLDLSLTNCSLLAHFEESANILPFPKRMIQRRNDVDGVSHPINCFYSGLKAIQELIIILFIYSDASRHFIRALVNVFALNIPCE